MSYPSSFPFHFSIEKACGLVDEGLRLFEDGELFIEKKTTEHLSLGDGRIKSAASNTSQGFGLRGLVGETTLYAHSSDVSLSQIQKASESLRSVGLSGSKSFSLEGGSPSRPLSHAITPSEMAFDQKVRLLQDIDSFARHLDRRVIQVSASLSEGLQKVWIVRSGGQMLPDQRLGSSLAIRLTVESASGRREHGALRVGGSHDLTCFLDPTVWQNHVGEALRKALLALDAIPMTAGVMPVILGGGSPGVLLHEAVGHGLEADFNRKGQSIFSAQMGQKIASEGVTVMDEGRLNQDLSFMHGALSRDDEGTPTQSTVLIENGIMTGHMCDRLNAHLMGKTSTGNGRRQSYAHMPLPRMTNTYMKGGTASLEDMLLTMKRGIYAVDFNGGQVDIVSGNFVFGASEAYLVEDGRITAPIKEATLIGNGPEVMKKIQMIGTELKMDEGFGHCGKNGQTVVVGLGQPPVLISELTVGGSHS